MQSNSEETWKESTEKLGTLLSEPLPKLGQLELSGDATPVMHLDYVLISIQRAATGSVTYLERTPTKTTLAGREGVGTVPVIEVEAAILLEGACRETSPVKAATLIRIAVVVRVPGALERGGIKPSLVIS